MRAAALTLLGARAVMQAMKALLILAPLLLFSSFAAAREFTGTNGRKIEAEIVSKGDDEVELKLEDGKTVTVPLTSLSPADRLYVEVWESPERKQRRLREVDLVKALEARGYVGFPIELRGQFEVVKIHIGDSEATFMFNHSTELPILDKAAVERLGLTMSPAEGGNVAGTVEAGELGNGTDQIEGTRIIVAPINGIPQGVDGLIGGQFFLDREARLDYPGKILWLKD